LANPGPIRDFCIYFNSDHTPVFSQRRLGLAVQIIDREGTDYLRQLLSSVSDEAQADYVVSTVHRAKGLEWDRVKVAGDFGFKTEDDGRISMADDEKRLLYVALTRARRLLELSELRADVLQMFLDAATREGDSTGARRPV
jgi:hypothetical protein